jgi:acyl-CoA thioester hydrolase
MSHPSYEQLSKLPSFMPQVVPGAFEDLNGHLNVRHYVGIASEGLDESLEEVGIPQNWPRVGGKGVFSAEHHLTYVHELRTGDRLSVRVLLLGRSERAAHTIVYLVDETQERISCVMEEIFLCVDMESRRTTPWPDDVAAKIDARIAEHQALDVSPTLSGSMSLR